ncbi:iron dicitrate transporter FecR [Parapedobacter defluvii]|uniref:Iron dicitrate transporter FecR n=1 Tax=Parapedobacter defluvii TaxID=2045106 RepID=A0ABQ1KZI5_9SPHI|nr:FecR family protein [Parapedobacter defluvii]GGC13511.1 iron dicitrate transporter FecR [Parapedobacter defluvii]
MSGKEHYEKLALKWLEGTITEAEKAEFTAWYNSYYDDKSFLPSSFAESEQDLEDRIFDKVRQLMKQPEHIPVKRSNLSWPRAIAAAAILFVCCSLGFFWWQAKFQDRNDTRDVAHDVQPGGNRATLTLSDGRVVELSDAQRGIVLANGKIQYEDGSQLIAAPSASPDGDQTASLLEMTTPKGGKYRVTLSDGTSVWLNSASTLRYPSPFGKGKRIVELDGEGYFDVSPDTDHPFVVLCNGQEVEVLGTAFNINSYADEEGIRTTLVHGKVSVRAARANSKSRMLLPGQQAVLQDDNFEVSEVDTAEITAWREGFFYFNNTDLHTVMRQFARWYDLKVSYEGMPTNEKFMGRIPMDMTLNSVFKVLAATGVDFEIKADRQLVVKGK